ncbi:MAG: ribonuclease H-like domain-containing protein [Candidatus Delongbacteria bacterium]|nr:ribonuclease H-like domain-containing protein [Candidatus Delongbacteria bacterium]MBN2835571.1 ribonuclease H-like domain-containing protein [Candidatus Delongbacteria bacterium]
MDYFNGYILTSENYDLDNTTIIKLSGIDNSGSFIIYLVGVKPSFFIRENSEIDPDIKGYVRLSSDFTNLVGKKLDCVYLENIRDHYEALDFFKQNNIITYESDIRLTEKLFYQKDIKSYIFFDGDYEVRNGTKVFINPEIARGRQFKPDFKILSLDIETSTTNDLYSIAYHITSNGKEKSLVMMIGENHVDNEELHFYPDEKSLISDFLNFISIENPDIIIGWHVVGFDLDFLNKKCEQFGIPFSLGRDGSIAKITEKKGSGFFCEITGRQVIDGLQVLRTNGYNFENFRLETVAKNILGVGKDISGTDDKIEEITRRFNEDKVSLAKYNLLDCVLVTKIFNQTRIIEKLLKKSELTGLEIDKLPISNAVMDHLMIPELYKKMIIANNQSQTVAIEKSNKKMKKEPEPGVYKNVCRFDFQNLAATVIKTFCIDNYSRIKNKSEQISAPSGDFYSSKECILSPHLHYMSSLTSDDEIVKFAVDSTVKAILNAFENSSSRFYDPDLINSVEKSIEWILDRLIKLCESKGFQVLMADHEDFYLISETKKDSQDLKSLANEIEREISSEIFFNFNVSTTLNITTGDNFDSFYVPKTGYKLSKKPFAALRSNEIIYNNFDLSKSDWTDFDREFRDKLIASILKSEEYETVIREYLDKFDIEKNKDKFVFLHRLPKKIDRSVVPVGDHIKAALLLDDKALEFKKEIRYIITSTGPIPIELNPDAFDKDYYLENQVKKLINSIISVFNQKYEDIIYGTQLTLFDF